MNDFVEGFYKTNSAKTTKDAVKTYLDDPGKLMDNRRDEFRIN